MFYISRLPHLDYDDQYICSIYLGYFTLTVMTSIYVLYIYAPLP